MSRVLYDQRGQQYWFNQEMDSDAAGQSMCQTAQAILDDQVYIQNNIRYYASIYKETMISGLAPGEFRYNNFFDMESVTGFPMTFNAVRTCVDTLVNKVSQHKPDPKFLTSAGSETLQKKAKNMEKFVKGVFYENNIDEQATKALRDSCLFGLGAARPYIVNNKIVIEIAHPSNIIVDQQCALNGMPNTIFHREFITKEDLFDLWPDKEEIIENSKNMQMTDAGMMKRDLVTVWEAHRRSVNGKPGRHMIALDSGVLLDEEYLEEYFPYAFIKYADDIMGFYGIGVAEQLRAIQSEIDKTAFKIQGNMELLAVPFILKHRGSEIHDEELLTNMKARLVEWSGSVPPQIVAPDAISPQVIAYLENLFKKAYEIVGISQLSSSSHKPSGLNSAVAMRTYLDIETTRFSVLSRRWEQFYIDLAKLVVRLAGKCKGYKVPYFDKTMEIVKFEGLDESDFVLQVHPASSLPTTPAGKLETVTEMLNSGMISPEEGRNLLSFPDLEKSNMLASAAQEDLEATFEHMLDKGEYIEPLIYQNLGLGMKMGTSYYLRAKIDGIEEEKLDLLLRWMHEANDLMNPPPPEPAPGSEPSGPPQEMGPGGPPMPPPGMEGPGGPLPVGLGEIPPGMPMNNPYPGELPPMPPPPPGVR
jgi:hypothetical protein